MGKQCESSNSYYCVYAILMTQWPLALLMGINASSLNPALPVIRGVINDTYQDRHDESPTSGYVNSYAVSVQSAIVWGTLIGSCFAKLVMDKFSRKGGIAFCHTLNLISIALMSPIAKLARSHEALVAGRALNGFSKGLSITIAAIIASETSANSRMTTYQALYSCVLIVSTSIGIAFGHTEVFGNELLWPLLTAASAPLSIMYLIAYPTLPQTPAYYLMRNEPDKAFFVLKRLRRADDEMLDYEFSKIKSEVRNDSKVQKASLRMMFATPVRRTILLVTVLTMCCNEFMGTQAITLYSNDMFREAGVPESYLTLVSMGIFLQCLIPSFLGVVLIRRVGSKKLFLVGTTMAGIGMGLFTFSSWLKSLSPVMPGVAIFAITFTLFGNSLGIQTTLFAIPSEINSPVTRPAAMSIGGFVYWLSSALVGTIIPYSIQAFGALAFLPFIFIAAIEVILVSKLLPIRDNNKNFSENPDLQNLSRNNRWDSGSTIPSTDVEKV